MKKHRRSRPSSPSPVAAIDAQRFRGSIITVLCNVGVQVLYGVCLNLSVDGTFALILFSIMSILQLIICAVIGFSFNSTMWLLSAALIFLVGCGVMIYASI